MIQNPTIYGRFESNEFYLTTMKAQFLLDNIQLQDEKLDKPIPGYKPPGAEPEFHQILVIAVEGGHPELIPIQLTDDLRHTQVHPMDIGVIQLDETSKFHLLAGHRQLDSIRTQIREGDREAGDNDLAGHAHRIPPEQREPRKLPESTDCRQTHNPGKRRLPVKTNPRGKRYENVERPFHERYKFR